MTLGQLLLQASGDCQGNSCRFGGASGVGARRAVGPDGAGFPCSLPLLGQVGQVSGTARSGPSPPAGPVNSAVPGVSAISIARLTD